MMTSLVLLVPIVVSVTAAPLENNIDNRLINQAKDTLVNLPELVLDSVKIDSKRSSKTQPTKTSNDSSETKTSQFTLAIDTSENRPTSPQTSTESFPSIFKKGARKSVPNAVNKPQSNVKASENDVNISQNVVTKSQNDGRKSKSDVKKSPSDVRKSQSSRSKSHIDLFESQTKEHKSPSNLLKSTTGARHSENDAHESQNEVHKIQSTLHKSIEKTKSRNNIKNLQNNVNNPSQTTSTEKSIYKIKSEKDSPESAIKGKVGKRSRKHKSFYFNYPLVPQIHHYPHYDSHFDDCNFGSEERTPGGKKKYQDSNIYYIRLPPTPYMFVPGLGYVSQPPRYSPPQPPPPFNPPTSHVRPFRPTRPPTIYQPHVNPFIKVPIDFISNGKPTSVYQWQDGKPISRPENQITNLDKGPYVFNGRPSSIYLLRPDGSQTIPQAIRYNDFQNNGYY